MTRSDTEGRTVPDPSAQEDRPAATGRASAFRDRIRSLPGGWLAWRIVVSVIGLAVIALGIVLLPLPGPGWLIIFAGLGILATEFEWASRLLGFARDKLGEWTAWVRRQPRPVQGLIGLAGLAFLAAVAYAAYLVYGG